MRRTTATLLSLAALPLLLAGAEASATPGELRARATATLEAIPTTWTGAPLRAEAGAPAGTPFVVGSIQSYLYAADEPLYLTAIQIDAHGVATVVFPTDDPSAARIPSGSTIQQEFLVEPPLGRSDLFVYGTSSPVTLQDLGFPAGTGPYPVVSTEESVDFTERVRGVLEARSGGVATARIRDEVEGRRFAALDESGFAATGDSDYTVSDVVRYFTSPRTRAIRRSTLDVRIEFPINSAQLTEAARRQLDVVGFALNDPELADKALEVGGHTCDLGSATYNDSLSEHRARSVRDYLVGEHGVNASRLVSKGYGESAPLELGQTEDARRHNRRVEFTLDNSSPR